MACCIYSQWRVMSEHRTVANTRSLNVQVVPFLGHAAKILIGSEDKVRVPIYYSQFAMDQLHGP